MSSRHDTVSLSVFAIFQNESHIINEWIRHYLDEGVEHFYLIDNGSTDDYKVKIQPYMDKITLFVDQTPSSQVKLYNKYILPNLVNTDWIIGCDLDEFIWATNTKTLVKTLDSLPEDVGLIKIPWEQHGSNGYIKQPKLVIPSFTKRRLCYDPVMIELKCIARSKAVKRLDVHYFEIYKGYRVVDSLFNDTQNGLYGIITEDVIGNSKIRCTHYQVQSLEWFRDVKMTRGDVAFSKNTRDESYFKERDYNDILDDSLCKKKKNKGYNKWTIVVLLFLLFLFLLWRMY